MPVVINEFEVVPAPSEAPPPDPDRQEAAPAPTPHDIERMVRRVRERELRLRAH